MRELYEKFLFWVSEICLVFMGICVLLYLLFLVGGLYYFLVAR